MPDALDAATRRAAERLADLDPSLPIDVERQLAGARFRSLETFDLGAGVALAGVLLPAMQLAWQVWRDLKGDRDKDGERRRRETLLRRLRLEIRQLDDLTPAQRDRVLDVVADEVLAAGDGKRG